MATTNLIALYIFTSVAHAGRLSPAGLLHPLQQLSRVPRVSVPRTTRVVPVVAEDELESTFSRRQSPEFQELESDIGALGDPETELEKKQQTIIENLFARAALEDQSAEMYENYVQIMMYQNGAAAWEAYNEAKLPLEEELEALKDKEDEALYLVQEVSALQAKIKQARSDISMATSQQAEMKIKCEKLGAELEEKVAERTKVDASRADCEEQLERLPKEIARTSEALAASEEAVVNGLARLEKIKVELVELRSKESEASARAVEVSKDLEERSTVRADLQSKTDAFDAKFNSLRQKLQQEENSIVQLESRSAQVEAEVATLPKAIEEAREKKTKWNNRLEKLQSTIKPNEEELAAVVADLDDTKKMYQRAQKAARDARVKLRNNLRERKRLEEQAHAFEAAIIDETTQAEQVQKEVDDLTRAAEDLLQRRDQAKRLLADTLLAQAEYQTSDAGKGVEAMALASLSGREMDEKVAFSGRALELAAQEAEGQLSVLREFQERMQDVVDTTAQQRLAAQQELEAIASAQASQAEQLRSSLDTMAKDMEELAQSVSQGFEKTVLSNSAQVNSLQEQAKRMRTSNLQQDLRFESMIGELKEKAALTRKARSGKTLEEDAQILLRRMQQLRTRREEKLASTSGQQILQNDKFEKTAAFAAKSTATAAKGIMDFFSSALEDNKKHREHSESSEDAQEEDKMRV